MILILNRKAVQRQSRWRLIHRIVRSSIYISSNGRSRSSFYESNSSYYGAHILGFRILMKEME